MLSEAEIDSFVANGRVAVRDALPADVLQACQHEIWSELGDRGVRREDPSTWRDPVVRINCPESEAFAGAGTQPVLWEAFDQLIGEGRWWRRRGVGGRRRWRPAGRGTSSSATRSWSTPRRGRTRAGSRGSWPSPASPCTTRSRWSPR
jgi:hypothetical protein